MFVRTPHRSLAILSSSHATMERLLELKRFFSSFIALILAVTIVIPATMNIYVLGPILDFKSTSIDRSTYNQSHAQVLFSEQMILI